MNIEELILKINLATEQLDFTKARKYMESNVEELEENKHSLNTNARELLAFVKERLENGHKPLSRQELVTIHTINMYANSLNVKRIKSMIKDHPTLLARPGIRDYLNKDAVVLLESIGAIEKD